MEGNLSDVGPTVAEGGLTLETISSADSFARLHRDWDYLVRAMPRPSPMLLHGWLREWWRHYGEDGTLAVHVAYRDGRLVGALPLCVRSRLGLRVLTFLGGGHSALADLMVAPGEGFATGTALVGRLASSDYDFADLFGLPGGSRLMHALGDSELRLVERSEAPVLDIEGDLGRRLPRKGFPGGSAVRIGAGDGISPCSGRSRSRSPGHETSSRPPSRTPSRCTRSVGRAARTARIS